MFVKPMVEGDRLPVLELTVTPDDGDDLSAITTSTPVVIRMRRFGWTEYVLENAEAAVTDTDDGTITVQYQWQTDDTADPGDYKVELTFTIAGRDMTLPALAPGVVRIRPRI